MATKAYNFIKMVGISADLDYSKIEEQLKQLLEYRKRAANQFIDNTGISNPNHEAQTTLKQGVEYANDNIKQLLGL